IDREAPRLRPKRPTTASKQIGAEAGVTGLSRALLPGGFVARASDFSAIPDRDRAAPALGELISHHALQNVGTRLEPEHCVGELDRSGLLCVKRGPSPPHSPSLPPLAPPVCA